VEKIVEARGEYVTIGDLALQLGTSRKRIGQIVRANKIEIAKKRVQAPKGEFYYAKAVSDTSVIQIQELLQKFNPPKDKRQKKGKIEEVPADVSYGEGIIISQDFKTGQTWGQGIRAWWERERVERLMIV